MHSESNAASKEHWIGVKDPDGNAIIFLTHKTADINRLRNRSRAPMSG
jgi:hypothetical protein